MTLSGRRGCSAMATATQSYRRQDRSLRLSFRFERATITLFDRREVEMNALPSNDLERRQPEERSGFAIEVQDHGDALTGGECSTR